MKPIEVSVAEARRIAVRAQLLDGTATNMLDTVRGLGYLQIDPISSVAPPQYLVLWSRLGAYDRAELDRLLWERHELVGGADIVQELAESGELAGILEEKLGPDYRDAAEERVVDVLTPAQR